MSDSDTSSGTADSDSTNSSTADSETSKKRGSVIRKNERASLIRGSSAVEARVKKIDGEYALVKFKDGKEDWVMKQSLVCSTKPKSIVGTTFRMARESMMCEAKVLKEDGDFAKIRYKNGKMDWVVKHALSPEEKKAKKSKKQPGIRKNERASLIRGSSTVEASVKKIDGEYALVKFKDGKQDWVMKQSLVCSTKPKSIVGSTFRMARESMMCEAKVLKEDGEFAKIRYKNGKTDWVVKHALSPEAKARHYPKLPQPEIIDEGPQSDPVADETKKADRQPEPPSEKNVAVDQPPVNEDASLSDAEVSEEKSVSTTSAEEKSVSTTTTTKTTTTSAEALKSHVEDSGGTPPQPVLLRQHASRKTRQHASRKNMPPSKIPEKPENWSSDNMPRGYEFPVVMRIFTAFDHGLTGSVAVPEVADILRCAGLYVSTKEVAKLLKDSGKGCTGVISFDDFVDLLAMRPKDSVEKMREAFKRFDVDGTNQVDVQELTKCLTTMGEVLTPRDVDELLKGMPIVRGKIPFETFCTFMLKA